MLRGQTRSWQYSGVRTLHICLTSHPHEVSMAGFDFGALGRWIGLLTGKLRRWRVRATVVGVRLKLGDCWSPSDPRQRPRLEVWHRSDELISAMDL
jgi:hypothetical protein